MTSQPSAATSTLPADIPKEDAEEEAAELEVSVTTMEGTTYEVPDQHLRSTVLELKTAFSALAGVAPGAQRLLAVHDTRGEEEGDLTLKNDMSLSDVVGLTDLSIKCALELYVLVDSMVELKWDSEVWPELCTYAEECKQVRYQLSTTEEERRKLMKEEADQEADPLFAEERVPRWHYLPDYRHCCGKQRIPDGIHLINVRVDHLGDECWIGVTYDKPLITGWSKDSLDSEGQQVLPSTCTHLLNPHCFPGGHTWALYGGRRYEPVYGPGDVIGVLMDTESHRCLFYINGCLHAVAECPADKGRPYFFATVDSEYDTLTLLDDPEISAKQLAHVSTPSSKLKYHKGVFDVTNELERVKRLSEQLGDGVNIAEDAAQARRDLVDLVGKADAAHLLRFAAGQTEARLDGACGGD